jgi:hypothetical protein
MPIILDIYYSESGELLTGFVYDLSPEPYQDNEARMGHCDEFTMDSLRNQIIGKPRELNDLEIGELLTD